MEVWLRFVLARRCINIYFEQTQWQQAADAKRYLSSIIYVFFFSLCLHLSRSIPPPHSALYTRGCTSIHTGSDAHSGCIHRGIA